MQRSSDNSKEHESDWKDTQTKIRDGRTARQRRPRTECAMKDFFGPRLDAPVSDLSVTPLVEHITAHGDVPLSLALDILCRAHNISAEGHYTLEKGVNILLDAGLSYEAVRLGSAIFEDKRLAVRPVLDPFSVMVIWGTDGARMLTFPLLKNRKPPAGGYKSPRWLPIMVDLASRRGGR